MITESTASDASLALLDHTYNYPNDLDGIREQCAALKSRVESLEREKDKQYMRAYRTDAKNKKLCDMIEEMRAAQMLTNEAVAALDKYEGKFSAQTVVHGMNSIRPNIP